MRDAQYTRDLWLADSHASPCPLPSLPTFVSHSTHLSAPCDTRQTLGRRHACSRLAFFWPPRLPLHALSPCNALLACVGPLRGNECDGGSGAPATHVQRALSLARA